MPSHSPYYYHAVIVCLSLWYERAKSQQTTTTTWPMPAFTLQFIVIDDGLNLTETEIYLESTLEFHLQDSLTQHQQVEATPWQLVQLVLQTPYVNRTFLGNESGIPVSLLRTDWSGVLEMELIDDSIDNGLLFSPENSSSTDQLQWQQRVYMALQGDALMELMRLWGNHPVLQNVIAKVQVEDENAVILDEANMAAAFPPVESPDQPSLFNKQTIIMTVILMAVMTLLLIMCWLYKKRRTKQHEERLRRERREKWNKLKERRDAEKAEKKLQQQEGTEEWMNEMTKSLTSIPVRDTVLRQNSLGKFKKSSRQSSLHRSSDLTLQGSSRDNLFAIDESEEHSSQFTPNSVASSSSPQQQRQPAVLQMENDDEEEDEFARRTMCL